MSDVDVSEIPNWFKNHCRFLYPSHCFPSGFPAGEWDTFAISQFCIDNNLNYQELKSYAESSGNIPPPPAVIKALDIKRREIRGTLYSMRRRPCSIHERVL